MKESTISVLAAMRDLGWKLIEMQAVEMPGHAKANFHDILDAAFDAAVKQLEQSGAREIHIPAPLAAQRNLPTD